MNTVVEAKGLVKRYNDTSVVDAVDLEIKQGECFGLLGPNGAGKSSILRMMYCTAQVTSGELYILGLNVKKNARQIKARIGVIPQEDGLDADFSVRENLLVYASYFGMDSLVASKRTEDLLRLVHLEDERDQFVQNLNGGMRRRLAVARGMINQPEILFLDEPTSGLDPQSRLWIWDFLKKIKVQVGSLVLSTQYMEEAEQLCDRIAIMDNGKILIVGAPKDLIQAQIGSEIFEFQCTKNDLYYYTTRLKENGYAYNVIRDNVTVYLQVPEDKQKVLALVTSSRIVLRKASLNDVFLKLAGHDLRGDIV